MVTAPGVVGVGLICALDVVVMDVMGLEPPSLMLMLMNGALVD